MPRSPMSSRHGWSGKAWSSDRVSTVTSVPVSKRRREGAMRRLGIVLAFSLAAGPARAQGKEPIALRDMGSFHVGGRVIEITGQPIKEIVFTPGGVPAKMDPNGKYQVEQMYVQYFLPQNRKGKLPLLLWHGGGLTGVTYETTPDGRDGWLNYFIRKGWDTYISDAVERRQGQPHDLCRRPVPDRGLRAVHEAGRAALAYHRRSDRRCLYRTGRQGLPLRGHGAQSVGHVRLPGAGGAPR